MNKNRQAFPHLFADSEDMPQHIQNLEFEPEKTPSLKELEDRLTAMGYNLEELDKDNPYWIT